MKDIKKGQKKRNPAPPFTTSTMGQEASRKLGFTLNFLLTILSFVKSAIVQCTKKYSS